MSKGDLDGVRVIKIFHHMEGPTATQKLGDLGADIIKVRELEQLTQFAFIKSATNNYF